MSHLRHLVLAAALIAASSQSAAEDDEPGVIRLQSQVTGDQEQPQVMYVVPWQAGELPELPYRGPERQLKDLFLSVEPGSLRRQLSGQAENPDTNAQ